MTRPMPQRVVIAAGGTGGHMFPALALAREVQGRGQDVVLACDARGARYVGPDLAHHEIRAGSPTGRPLRRLQGVAQLGLGLTQALALLRRMRPVAVAVFGGYASAPVGIAARLLRIPLLVHEQNAVLGRANRLIARKAAVLALTFADTKGAAGARRAQSVVTGNPVRPEVVALRDRAYAAPARDGPFDLLVVGGSQGARILSEVLPTALACLPKAARARIRLTQQCRPEDLERVAGAYAGLGFPAELKAFYDDLPERLARAHLVISRSGASSVAELLVLGRPALLVPYRLAADDHQRANAAAVVQAGAGWLIEETALEPERLAARLDACLDQPEELALMAARAHALGRPDAARALADAVESLLAPSAEKNLRLEALA
jgi:UDP-N-acetylglucosamine--N-acetylmuramyl-(pentapeptide) pyrophosphoryl-undecaprenol N-acetylglucosamine transferase